MNQLPVLYYFVHANGNFLAYNCTGKITLLHPERDRNEISLLCHSTSSARGRGWLRYLRDGIEEDGRRVYHGCLDMTIHSELKYISLVKYQAA